MKIRDVLGSAASGSKGSVTASRNRGGQYLRNRSVPTNPNTIGQQNAREALGSLTPQWSSVLTNEQRIAWNLYANNVPMIDSLGQTIKLSGINQFVRSNAPRVQAGLAVIVDAPTTFNIGDTPVITSFIAIIPTVPTDPILGIQGTVLTPASADDRVLVYIGRPMNGGISYFRGPYRAVTPIDNVDPDAGTWSTDYDSTQLAFTFTPGQAMFTRVQVSRADGRLSADAQARTIVTAE